MNSKRHGGHRVLKLSDAINEKGFPVTCVSNYLLYSDARKLKPFGMEHSERKLTIYVPYLNIPWKGTIPKLIMRSFFSISLLMALPFVGRVDVIYGGGPHPFTDIFTILVKKLKRAKLVVDIHDLEPEVLRTSKDHGIWIKILSYIGRLLYKFVLTEADVIVTLNDSMRKMLSEYTDKKILLIPNAVDTRMFRPIKREIALERVQHIAELISDNCSFTFVYTGIIGPFQGLDKVIEIARALQGEGFCFIIIGEGEEKLKLIDKVQKTKITNVFIYDYQDHQIIPYILNAADMCWLPLGDVEVLRMLFPHKLFEYAACGRPIFALCPRGEVTEFLLRTGAGIAMTHEEDVDNIVELIRKIPAEYDLKTMGRNARAAVECEHSLSVVGNKLATLLLSVST